MAKLERYQCDECGKELEGSELCITVIEHTYKHEHHFCGFTCLGNWAKKYVAH